MNVTDEIMNRITDGILNKKKLDGPKAMSGDVHGPRSDDHVAELHHREHEGRDATEYPTYGAQPMEGQP